MIYTADPWSVMASSLEGECRVDELATAQSFVRQAREYFRASDDAAIIEAKPLLYYYSFLNLGKALSMARRRPGLIGWIGHGVSHHYVAGESLGTAKLTVHRGSATRGSAFGELHHALSGKAMTTAVQVVPVSDLLPQLVVGHRMWIEASGRRERFVSIDHLRLVEDKPNNAIWMVLEIEKGRLVRRNRGVSETLTESGLSSQFRVVKDAMRGELTLRRFEQIAPVTYTHRAADNVMDVLGMVKPFLHRTITAAPPYRRYYLYLCPPSEERIEQMLVSYLLMFFLGSLSRYHPDYLLKILDGPYGTFFREFLTTQPQQMVYAFASELKRQEVSRAAVV
jgi:hypothetical protein